MAKQRFTPAQVSAVLIRTKGLVHLAARLLGCSYQTVLNYIRRYPSVKGTLEEQRGELLDVA